MPLVPETHPVEFDDARTVHREQHPQFRGKQLAVLAIKRVEHLRGVHLWLSRLLHPSHKGTSSFHVQLFSQKESAIVGWGLSVVGSRGRERTAAAVVGGKRGACRASFRLRFCLQTRAIFKRSSVDVSTHARLYPIYKCHTVYHTTQVRVLARGLVGTSDRNNGHIRRTRERFARRHQPNSV